MYLKNEIPSQILIFTSGTYSQRFSVPVCQGPLRAGQPTLLACETWRDLARLK